MNKVTLLFPGQGSQYVGMGKALHTQGFSDYFKRANQALGYDITQLMLEGPEDKLTLTENTQPAIITHSLLLWEAIKPILSAKQVQVDRVLGHSVGEYAALSVAGSLSFEEAVRSVHYRGKFMQEAVPAGAGKMYALLKAPQEMVEQACKAVSKPNCEVMPANFNEPNQIVISGHAQACDDAINWLKQEYKSPFRAVELKVSAPFHSSLMKPAAEKMKQVLNDLPMQANQISYIANKDAKEYKPGTAAQVIKQNLVDQIAGSVYWTQSIQQLPSNTLCLEVGPSKVLAGLVKKINPEIKVVSLDLKDSADIKADLQNLLREELGL